MALPYRKKRVSPFKKRRYVRKNIRRRPMSKSITNVRTPGRPDKVIVKLQYSDNYQLTTTSGATAKQQWKINSLWDPDLSGGGHQPYFADQWAAMYARYRVFKCTYEIYMTNLGADTALQGVITGAAAGTTTIVNQSAFETPHSRRFQLGNRDGSSTKVVKGSFYIPPILGLTSTQYKTAYDTFGVLAGSDPAKKAYLNLLLDPINPAESVAANISVRLTYHCELFDPVQPSISLGESGQV